ncbi:MAG TPA: hypothetical protein V6C95_16685 [Coleofasciculaceae cyanobacterium]
MLIKNIVTQSTQLRYTYRRFFSIYPESNIPKSPSTHRRLNSPKFLPENGELDTFKSLPENSIFSLCPQCGSPQTKLGAGKKPREASLLCANCGKFIRWIGAGELNALLKGGAS